jgi:HSP20 family protein
MANITRFDPFNDLMRFDPFGTFDELWHVPRGRALWKSFPQESVIRLDVSEDEKAYRVKADVPGVRKEDLQVSIDGNNVSISAEVKGEEEEKKGETLVRSERYYGRQYRSFALPHEVDQARAEAKYENGVLELILPKREGTRAKQLTVK